MIRHAARLGLIIISCCALQLAHAEQKQVFGDYEVHYIVVPTTFLKPDVAAKYGITRSENRALLNVSVLKQGTPVSAGLAARSRNLLSQISELEFEEVREGPAIYYLALIRHSDEAVHQISIDVDFEDGSQGTVDFQQRLYHEG